VAGNRFAATLIEGCNGQDSDQEKTAKHPDLFDRRERLYRVSLRVAKSIFTGHS
jgi:hypothetical protein